MENINMVIAEKLGEFVKGRLLQNKAHLDNSGNGISTDEVIGYLNELRSINNYEGAIENTSSYREFAKRCAGSINFTYDEIEEIANLVKESIKLDGVGTNVTHWDVLSFAIKRLDKVRNGKQEDDALKASKYIECLQLDRMPLYYKPFACVIACGYPYSATRITNIDGKVIYNVNSKGEVLTDDLLEDMFLTEGIEVPNQKACNDVAIKTAVDWWAQAIVDPTFVLRYDPNASYLSSVLALVSTMHKSAPDEAAMEVFKKCLADEIKSGLEADGHYTISVNYRLDPVLDAALQKSRLGGVDYNWNTNMDISADEVSITLGRGDKQILFDARKNEKTTGIQKVKA